MLRSKEPVHPKLLAKVFKQICEENHTGILQVITKKVEVLSFDIKNGKISSIKYRTKRNKEALEEIGAIEESKYTFYERKEVGEIDVDIEIPTNDEVLQYLLGQSIDSSSNSVEANTNNKDNTQQLPNDIKERLKKALTEKIGPMSNIICKEVFAEATDVNTAINMLASKIPDASLAQSFRAEAKRF